MKAKFFLLSIVLMSAFVSTPHPVLALKTDEDSLNQTQYQADAKPENQCPQDVARGCSCKEKVREVETFSGPCIDEKQVCGNETISYSCCLCDQPVQDKYGQQTITELKASSGHTYTSCSELCKKLSPPGRIGGQVGAVLLPHTTAKAELTAAQVQANLAMCFTRADCAKLEYGGSVEAFRPGYDCPANQGRCLAPEPDVELSFPIGGIKTVQGLRGFIAVAFRYIVGIAVVAGAVVFVIAGVRYIFGSAYQNLGKAKDMMVDAGVGLVLVLGSMTILQTINPATLKLNKLNIFLINKQQILSARFCEDSQTSGPPLEFAEAGSPPAYTPVQNITSWPYKAEDTRCNYEYYAKGFTDNRCLGRKCDATNSQGKPLACLSCKSGACSPGADPKSYGCVEAGWGGNIDFVDDRYVEEVTPILICGDAVKYPNDPPKSLEAIFELGQKETPKVLQKASGGKGSQSYMINFTEQVIQEAGQKCQGHGGVLGIALGIQYNDGVVPTDELAILGKRDCGTGDFSGYADGQRGQLDTAQMRYAAYCGIVHKDVVRRLSDPKNLWSVQDIEAILGKNGKTVKPIQCDFSLSNANAPSEPQAKKIPTCPALPKTNSGSSDGPKGKI